MKKFYYNGKLVRTSKTHDYKYAIAYTDDSKILSCHGTYEAAQKEMNKRITEQQQTIYNLNNAKKALINGSKYYFVKFGRNEYRTELPYQTVEEFNEKIKTHEKMIEWYRNNRKIVELQAE